MKELKGWKKKDFLKKTFLGIGVLVMALLFCFGLNQKGDVKAATSRKIMISGEDVTFSEFHFTDKNTLQIIYSSDNLGSEEILWEIIIGDCVVVEPKGENNAVIKAVGVGDATLNLTVKDKTTGEPLETLTCDFHVDSAIIEESYFEPDPLGGDDKVVILEHGEKKGIKLLFESKDHAWEVVEGTGVVTVDNDGNVEAVGTGKAKIEYRYTPDGTNAQGPPSILYVYVKPAISTSEEPDVVNKLGKAYYVYSSSSELASDIYMGINPKSMSSIENTVDWKITSGMDGTGTEYVNTAKGKNSGMLICDDLNGWWKINAEAGEYYLTVAPKGCLDSEYSSKAQVEDIIIRVYAEPKDILSSLQVDDYFDVAKKFNIPKEEFDKYFLVDTTVPDWADINKCFDIVDGVITAVERAPKTMDITFKVQSGMNEFLPDGGIKTEYKISFSVYEGFKVSTSQTKLPVNSVWTELEALYPKLNEDVDSIEWSVSKENYLELSDTKGAKIKFRTLNKETGTLAEDAVTITCTARFKDGRVLMATCDVWIYVVAEGLQIVETLDSKEPLEKLDLRIDESLDIFVKLIPDKIFTANLEWSCSNDKVKIEPNSDGTIAKITGLEVGEAVITVVNKDNSDVASCVIRVYAPIKEITLDKGEAQTVYKYYGNYRITAKISPDDATNTELKWYSTDVNVLKVDPDETGKTILVELVGAGEADIVVQPRNVSVYDVGEEVPKARCTITVKESATDIGVTSKVIEVTVGESKEVEYSIISASASTEVTWKALETGLVDFEKNVTIVKNGEREKQYIKGKKAGRTYIIAQTKEGQIATFEVVVKENATGVKVDLSSVKVAVGETVTVKATPDPETSTETDFTWDVKDKNIAKVDDKGSITGVSAGETIVTVKTSKGGMEIVYVTVYDKAEGMTLSHSEVTIVKGETFTLKPIFTPSNVTNKNVTWTSLNEKVATISKDGKIKALKGGTTVITAVSEDGGYFDTCVVTVTERITSVKLNESNLVLGVGKTYKLKATVKSNSASNPKVKWTTSNKKIVKVSKNGNLRGMKVGTATITVKVTDGTNKKATCKVRVVRPATKVTLNKKVLNIVVGQTGTLKATIKPSNATLKTVTWSSADSTIAEVDQDGTIFGLSLGQTKVTATAKDNSGKKASCYVNVIEEIPASSIVLSAKSLTLVKGDSEKIGYSIVPHNNTDKVYFDSDNRAVASVNGNGKVYGKRAGVANITISTSSGKQATVKVTVLGLNKTKLTMEQYDTETLFIDGTTTGITWFTSNPSVATVQQGKVVARKAGKCAIYAKVNGISLKCTVVVKKINK